MTKPIVVIKKSRPLPPAPPKLPPVFVDPAPKATVNPVVQAFAWLHGRLEDRGELGYFLDGRPAKLKFIIEETKRAIEANTASQEQRGV